MPVSMARRILAAGILLLAATAFAFTQAPSRVRGTIEAVDGNTITVKSRDGEMLKDVLADNAIVLTIMKRSLADIQPGVFLGTAATPDAAGALRAIEVHIFPESMRGTGEGHRADLKIGKRIYIPAAMRAEDATFRTPRVSVEGDAPPPL